MTDIQGILSSQRPRLLSYVVMPNCPPLRLYPGVFGHPSTDAQDRNVPKVRHLSASAWHLFSGQPGQSLPSNQPATGLLLSLPHLIHADLRTFLALLPRYAEVESARIRIVEASAGVLDGGDL